MPTYARGQIVLEDEVGVDHCIARCVRRAFLRGVDPYTGQDYSHRKEWILDRMVPVQAGGGPIELARRCRGAPLAPLVPGQGGGSNRLCVGHWLDAQP